MSLIRRLRGGSAGLEQRGNPSWANPPRPGEDDIYALLRNQGGDSALQFLAVFACVRLLSDSISSLPIDVYRKTSESRRQLLPTPPLLGSPFPAEYSNFEWLWRMVSSLALRGNSYHYKVFDGNSAYPVALLPIHPDDVEITRADDYSSTRHPKIVYRICGDEVPSFEVLHIRRFPTGNVEGLSPIGTARTAISIGLHADQYGDRYFKDSASPSSVLETEQDLSDAAAKQLQAQWRASHGGRRYPAVLTGGLKWKPISLAPEDSQFLETKAFQRQEIAMMYGIPPHMIGDTQRSTSWGAGIEQQSIGFTKFTLNPWLRCIEEAMSTLLPRGQFMRFNVEALLRGDQKARYEAYTQARNAGWLSVNEIRETEDREPIPDGDEFIQPLNMGPIGFTPESEPPVSGQ